MEAEAEVEVEVVFVVTFIFVSVFVREEPRCSVYKITLGMECARQVCGKHGYCLNPPPPTTSPMASPTTNSESGKLKYKPSNQDCNTYNCNPSISLLLAGKQTSAKKIIKRR